MQGSIFTSRNVVNDTLHFMKKNKSEFISTGHEKRFFTHEFQNQMYLRGKPNKKNIYLQKQLNKIRNPVVKKIIKINSRSLDDNLNFKINDKEVFRTEYHTPKYRLSLYQKIKIFLKSLIRFKDLKILFNRKILIYNHFGPLYLSMDHISQKVK